MTNTDQRCIICGLQKQEGLVVRDHLICENCERTIVSTSPTDDSYGPLVQRVKQLWVEVGEENTGSNPTVPAGKPD